MVLFCSPWIVRFFLICSIFLINPISAQSAPRGGQIVVPVSSDPKTFNDIVASETTSSAVTEMLFEGLTTVDPISLQVIPQLAERWEVSSDGLSWTFYLRHGVTWSDGVPLTAADVVFTFNDLIYNPAIPSSSRDVFTIEGKKFLVEALDDFRVRFTLPVKFAPFLRSMSQAILPKHCLKAAVDRGQFSFTWGIDTPPQNIVGTGPFYLKQYVPGQRLVFERNAHYWKKGDDGKALPYLDKVIFVIIPSPEGQLLKFIDGELDYIPVRGADYPLLKPLEHQKNFILFDAGPAFGSSFITFNLNNENNPTTGKPYLDPVKLSWFSDLRFRQAVAHVIDRSKMIEILTNGFGTAQYGPMSPSGGYFYNAKVKHYDYDLEAARKLLKEAGFKQRQKDGVLEDAQGHAVKFNLYTGANADVRISIGAMIRADLAQLGMDVNFTTLEFNALVAKLMSTYDWDAVIISLTGGVEPHFGQNVWLSSGQLHMWHPKQKTPQTSWEKRLDELFTLGVQELDEGKRKVLYDEFQVIAAQQLPMIYTVLENNIYAIRQRFGNLKPTAYGGALHNLEEIYVE